MTHIFRYNLMLPISLYYIKLLRCWINSDSKTGKPICTAIQNTNLRLSRNVHLFFKTNVFAYPEIKCGVYMSIITQILPNSNPIFPGWEMDRDSLYPFYRPHYLLSNVPYPYPDIYSGRGSLRYQQTLVFPPYSREVFVVQKPKHSSITQRFCHPYLQSWYRDISPFALDCG